MSLLIVIGILLLIGLIPVGVYGSYGTQGARLWVRVGVLRFAVYPPRKKKDNHLKNPKKKRKADAKSDDSGKKKKGSVTDFLPVLQVVFNILEDFRRKVRVNHLKFNLILAGGDPCDLAINYGRAWALLGNLLPHLERHFNIKKRDLQVQCDFEADTTNVEASIDLTLTVAQILHMICIHGIHFLQKYYKIVNNAKDGAMQ